MLPLSAKLVVELRWAQANERFPCKYYSEARQMAAKIWTREKDRPEFLGVWILDVSSDRVLSIYR